MAKTPATEERAEVVPLNQRTHVPSEARQRASTGSSVSHAADDAFVPFAIVVQRNSPQVDAESDKYVEGAQPGDIILTNDLDPIISGHDGVEVQPIHHSRFWNEWRPRKSGGGLVNRYPYEGPTPPIPGAVRKADPDNPERVSWVLPNGNVLVETRYLVTNVLRPNRPPTGFVFSLSSTGHTFFKSLNGVIKQMRHPNGNPIEFYDRKFLFRTRQRQNVSGKWFTLSFEDRGFVPDDLWEMGKALYEEMQSGDKKIGEEVAAGSAGTSDDGIPF